MCPVHIRICHDNYFVITKLFYIKIITVTFHKTAPESKDHRLDLGISEHLVYGSLLHI